MRISSAINDKKDLVRNFLYHRDQGLPLRVTLKYRAAKSIEDEVGEHRTRLMSRAASVTVSDRAAEERAISDIYDRIVADNVVKIAAESVSGDPPRSTDGPVTWRHLLAMLPLSPEQVAANGGLDAAIDMDPTVAGGDKDAVESAKANILTVVQNCLDFKRWVEALCSNIGHFQDEDFAEQIKNSQAGKPA